MENLRNLAGMASAVAGSFAVSLLLGWLSLRGILLLMPARNVNTVKATGTNRLHAA
jgi:hypothetical protein